MIKQLKNKVKINYICFNILLQNINAVIDNINDIAEYYNLIILQSTISKIIKKMIFAFLISVFYFVLNELSKNNQKFILLSIIFL